VDNEDDGAFRALADPTRRQLLDLLFERDGRTLGELEHEIDMTRFGVMKHLRVLEEAGLVVSRRSGREKLHFLNAVPIRLMHDRWIDKFTEPRLSALAHLKDQLEDTPMSTTDLSATTTQVHQIFIKAPAQSIWEAITQPEFSARYFYGARVDTTAEVGSPFRYHSPDGSRLWGDETVLEADPPHRLVVTWRSLYDAELAAEPASRVTWEIEPQDGGYSLLRVVHDRLEGAPKTAESVSGPGWMMVLSGLKTLLETGAPITND
jgi:uncharacterized protein YndB with AHSA1/START domain/DNA-binding transcriptional ArsR family regulator